MIKLLSKYLKEDGLTVINCDDGADTQVVETVLDFACKKKTQCYCVSRKHKYIFTTFVLLEQWHG